jgi:RNA polymerase sigma-70 factor, ECF subfamily
VNTSEEWDLIALCLSGRTAAFEPLVRRHEGPARLIAEGMLGDPDDAADVVQDAFVKAYRALRQLKTGSAFGPWFRTIVRNQCRDHLRSSPAGRRVSWEADALGREGASESDGSGAIERSEISRAVHAALAKLSPEQREVLVLKEMEGLSYAAIAEETGVPAGTVASRIHHARAALRRIVFEAGNPLEGVDG